MKVYSALIVLALMGCQSGARTEAHQVAEAMDRFRKAPNSGKGDLVAPLRDVKCSAPDVCSARAACLRSAEPTARSLALLAEATDSWARVDAGTLPVDSAEVQGLASKLDEAKRLGEEGMSAMTACDDQVIALRRTYQF